MAAVLLALALGAPPTPLLEALHALPSDPAAAKLNADQHHFVSNERRPDLFYRAVKGRAGVWIGVGAEQNYVMAAWAKAEVIVLLDFDPTIVTLHAIHRALFLECETAAEFVAAWSDPARAKAAIERFVPESEQAEARRILDLARTEVAARLLTIREGRHRVRRPTFLSDPEQYTGLRALFRANRVVRVRGDLTGDATMAALARVLTTHGAAVSVLYLSNAEQYFMYTPRYRANVLALPFAKRAQILRTLPARPRGFHYMVQSARRFGEWLRRKRATSVYRMVGFEKGQHYEEGTFRRLKARPGTHR